MSYSLRLPCFLMTAAEDSASFCFFCDAPSDAYILTQVLTQPIVK